MFFALASCTGESDGEYVQRNKTSAIPGCANAVQAKLNLSADAAKSVCTCTFNRLFSENSIKELRRQEKAGERAATDKLVQPLMLACYQAEVNK